MPSSDTQFKPGQSGNPAGKPKGSLNFSTKFKIAIDKLGKKNKITGDELEEQIIQMAIKKAREGDLGFYRDVMDRVYGKPQQSVDHTSDGEQLHTLTGFSYTPPADSSNTSTT